MDTTKKASKLSKLSKFIKSPIRILIKARDIYIKSMSECSDRLGYGTVMGCPTGQVVNTLPKSFSVNSTKSSSHDDDYRELLRAASTRGLNSRVQLDVLQRQQSRKSLNTTKSFSVNSTKSSSHDDDYRELLRAASTRGLNSRVQLDVLQRQQSRKSLNTTAATHMPRSHSVGIGRIDEEKACEFEDDFKVRTDVFPRSRSYAVHRRSSGVL